MLALLVPEFPCVLQASPLFFGIILRGVLNSKWIQVQKSRSSTSINIHKHPSTSINIHKILLNHSSWIYLKGIPTCKTLRKTCPQPACHWLGVQKFLRRRLRLVLPRPLGPLGLGVGGQVLRETMLTFGDLRDTKETWRNWDIIWFIYDDLIFNDINNTHQYSANDAPGSSPRCAGESMLTLAKQLVKFNHVDPPKHSIAS